MKSQIEAALRPLIGEPLTDMWRYAGCQKFEFGVQRPAMNRRGEAITLADFGLVVSCDWRLVGPDGRVVSSDDFGPGDTRRDTGASPFYDLIRTTPPVVEDVEASDGGALSIRMSQGFTLEVSPAGNSERNDEQWQFMPKGEGQAHVVLWGDGLGS